LGRERDRRGRVGDAQLLAAADESVFLINALEN
jgi:hypothetical protein